MVKKEIIWGCLNMEEKEKLLKKSKEIFSLVSCMYCYYSGPYKIETVCILLCNAWELMLKAYIIGKKGKEGIVYKNKQNKGRTIGLNECISKVFTNKHDILRKHLESVIRYRNSVVHYTVDSFDLSLYSKIEYCIVNFKAKMCEFHNVNMSDMIVNQANEEILKNDVDLYKYSKKSLCREINNVLKSLGIEFKIDSQTFELFDRVYGIKENKEYCLISNVNNRPSYRYSSRVLNFIVGLIQKNPNNIKEVLKNKIKK